MKVLFCGLGSIGQKYYKLLNENFNFDIYALRSQRKNRNSFSCLPLCWDEIDIIKPDVAIITNPTYKHIRTAIQCAERGMHLLIAKPLDCSTRNLSYLQDIVSAKSLTSFIAYPLRHLPVVKELKSKIFNHSVLGFVCHTNLANWRSYKTYSAKYSEGGGALLELSHELDLATYLLGDVLKINGYAFNLSDETDAEEVAKIVLFHKGDNMSFHNLNLASDVEERYITAGEDRYEIVPDDQMYIDMFKYFFDNIGKLIMNNIFEASKLFRLLMEFRHETNNNDLCKRREQGSAREEH